MSPMSKEITRFRWNTPKPGVVLDIVVGITRQLAYRLRGLLPKLGWSLLFGIHLPVFVAVWSSIIFDGADLGRISNGLALALTLAFFILKIRDVAFLRLRKRQQSFVAFCLLTAVVHHGAIAPNVDEAMLLQATAVVAGGVAAHRLARRAPRLLRDWFEQIRIALSAWSRHPARQPAIVVRRAPSRRRRFIPHSVPRAPPARP
jgi:hypothetical protein